jgi:DNA polymerase I
MKKLLLIDSHALIHRMFHAMAPLTGPQGEPVGALYGLAKLLLKIKAELNPDYIAACGDRPEPTFRKEQYTAYKATRQPTDTDLIPQITKMREVFDWFKIRFFELPGFEADDLIGTLATKLKMEPDLQIIILSGDRDMLQLVEGDKVVVDLLVNGDQRTILMNEGMVFEKYGLKPKQIIDLKGLIGDTSDNIPGVMGIGEKSATPLLQEFETIEGIYENLVIISPKTAKKLEGHIEEARMSRDLATIHTTVPIFIDSLEDLKALPLDKPSLITNFSGLGFVSLIRQLEG